MRQTLVIDQLAPEIVRTLSPNGRAHWRPKNDARKAVTAAAAIAIKDQRLVRVGGPVVITYRWIVPDRRKRDLDNHSTGVVKVVQDCLVKGEILPADDSSWVTDIQTEIVYEKGRRALVIEIQEVTG